jgi:apolipoprotein N-acyltransferase
MKLKLPPRAASALAALACGAAAGLAHPPFGLLPGLLGWAGLLLLLDRVDTARPLRSAFWRGWAMAVGYFLVGTWWIAEAFLVDVASHGWMAPFAVMLLPTGMGLFWGAAAMLHRLIAPPGAARVLSLAAAFGLIEWIRGGFLTGFPWNLPGNTWAAGSAVSQVAAIVGVFGLSVLTVAIAAAPAALFDKAGRRARAVPVSLAALVLAGLWGHGAWRLQQADVAYTDITVRVVQPDVDQKDKWRPENLPAIVDDYVRLSRAPGAEQVDVVIWPEGALPALADALFAEPTYAARLTEAVSPGQFLFMGANRLGGTPEAPLYHNSLLVLRREADGLRVMAAYDKHRLLPLGEYLPLGGLMTRLGVRALVHMPSDYTPGPPPAPLAIPGLPVVQPLICYESVYPGLVGRRGPRPRWLVIPSNDSWYGETSGPWQHLNVGAFRAIEQGVPMVRATPTGVSAMIDPYGRTGPDDRLGTDVAGVVDARLPAPLSDTIYSRWREIPFWALIVFCASVALLFRTRAQKSRDSQA